MLEITPSNPNVFVFKKYCASVKEGLESIFCVKNTSATVKRDGQNVVHEFQEKLTLESDLPPILIIQLA